MVDVELPRPAPARCGCGTTAVGLNFIDTYHRSGLYPVDAASGLGLGGGGRRRGGGRGRDGFAAGDRVGFGRPARRLRDRAQRARRTALCACPTAIDDRTAAAVDAEGQDGRVPGRALRAGEPGEAC